MIESILAEWVAKELQKNFWKKVKKVKKVLDKQNKAWYNKEVATEIATKKEPW